MLDITRAGRAAPACDAQSAARMEDTLVLSDEHRVTEAAPRGATLIRLFNKPETPAPTGSRVLDEAALRELVRHYVQAELNTSLGERLTRRIRALVRGEVLRLIGGRTAD